MAPTLSSSIIIILVVVFAFVNGNYRYSSSCDSFAWHPPRARFGPPQPGGLPVERRTYGRSPLVERSFPNTGTRVLVPPVLLLLLSYSLSTFLFLDYVLYGINNRSKIDHDYCQRIQSEYGCHDWRR